MRITDMTAVSLAAAIREGKTTAVEATQAMLDRIEEEDKQLNCYVTVNKEGALRQAARVQEKIEKGELSGPLAGVPMAVKDNLCTEGITSCQPIRQKQCCVCRRPEP